MTRALADVQAVVGAGYRVERELGGGGMSRVFLAEDVALQRRVVLKLLTPELQQAVSAERFAREVRTVARLQHPGIVPVLAAGESGGVAWYAMPYVEGESLRHRLATGVPIPLADVRRWAHDLFDALAAAHAQGIVHRDIKPENLLLSGARAALADFGIARAVRESATDQRLTATGIAIGTPAYMAPEQALADAAADERVDLYAAGLVLYEMLAGRGPFEATTPQQLVAAHLTVAPPPVTQYRPDVSPALAALVAQCLEKDPARRPASAAAVRDALDALAPASGASSSPPRPARAESGRRAWGIIAAVVVVAAGLTWWTQRPSSGRAKRDLLVLADVAANPADSSLARAMGAALRIDLGASPRLVLPDPDRLQAVRATMGVPPRAPLYDTTARAVALRLGAKALIAPRLERLGAAFVLSARIVAPEGGADVRALRTTARDSAGLIEAIDHLGRDLREAAGESVTSLADRVPLPLLTTKSLPALERAAAGLRAQANFDNITASEAFADAVRLDSGFAAAWQGYAQVLRAIGRRPDDQGRAFRRAYALRDRLTPGERLSLEADWAIMQGRSEEATGLIREALATNGPSLRLRHQLANLLMRRQPAAALALAESLLVEEPSNQIVRETAINAALQVGDSQRVDALLAANPLANSVPAFRLRHGVALTRHDWELAVAMTDSALVRLRGTPREAYALSGHAASYPVLGRFEDAHRVAERRIYLSFGIRDTAQALDAALAEIAPLAIAGGQVALARQRLQEALRRIPVSQLAVVDRRYPELALAYAAVGDSVGFRATRLAMQRDMPREFRTRENPKVALGEGWLALQQGKADVALARFDTVRAILMKDAKGNSVADAPRGLAFVALGQRDSATAAFRRYLASRSELHRDFDPLFLGLVRRGP